MSKIKELDHLTINPTGISYGFTVHYKVEDDGMVSGHIPAFNLYFSTEGKDNADLTARAMVQSFFNYWLIHKGFRSFLLKIMRLGFKANSHDELKHLLDRSNLNVKLKAGIKQLPRDFAGAETYNQDGNLAIAV